MPSNHLILCCPLLQPSVFPNIRVFSNESALHIRWPKYWSFSFNINPSNEQVKHFPFYLRALSQAVLCACRPPAPLEMRTLVSHSNLGHLFSFPPTEPTWGEQCSVVFWGALQLRQWQPTPALLSGKSHGQRSLVGCSPWGPEESDTTERLHFQFSLSCTGEGNGSPLQYSCLENPRDVGAWWAAALGVAQSRTRLQWLSSSSSLQNAFKSQIHHLFAGLWLWRVTGLVWVSPPIMWGWLKIFWELNLTDDKTLRTVIEVLILAYTPILIQLIVCQVWDLSPREGL